MCDAKSRKNKLFLQLKEDCLGKTDLSRKGSIDEPIRDLVEIINRTPYYYTTSTCSGRITLISKPVLNSGIKKGSVFHLNAHDEVENADIFKELSTVIDESKTNLNNSDDDNNSCLWLKFEPFIVHIQCYDLEKAKTLLNLALASGCRNSGITLGKPDKFMVAVRSAASMEVPLHFGGSNFKLEPNYVEFLVTECNHRMRDNFERLQKFQKSVESDLK